MDTTTAKSNLDALNKLLAGEITALDSYSAALKSIKNPEFREILEFNRNCHSLRVDKLTAEVNQLGGKPSRGAALWGAFAGAIGGGAAAISDKLAIDILEEGEDHWLKEYKTMSNKLENSLMASDLLTKQQKSHDAMSNLKKTLR